MRSKKATKFTATHTARPRSSRKRQARSLRGFTAAELSAVAAIIAILALVIVPIFRDRVDEARRVGTLDDMQGLAKGILLANADTAIYPRLNDLDNGQIFNDPPTNTGEEVPLGAQLRVVPYNSGERQALANLWKGPYNAVQNSILLIRIEQLFGGALVDDNEGPIRIYGNPAGLPFGGNATSDSSGDRYPVDHYGNPYLYYPPGLYVANLTPTSNESEFSGGLLVSFGPNGLIGDGTNIGGTGNPLTNPYRRESGVPGTGDDLVYYF